MTHPETYLQNYNIHWNTQSRNSGESMPFGGRDIGCNVWVENNDVLLYMAQSGAFDTTGHMLKAGRIRLSFDRNVFADSFSQTLQLEQGSVRIHGTWDSQEISILMWNETEESVLHIEMQTTAAVSCQLQYETWRDPQLLSENSDEILPQNENLLFCHRNTSSALLDERLAEQGIEHLKPYFPDVEKNRTSGGLIRMPGMTYTAQTTGEYMGTRYIGYAFRTAEPVTEQNIHVYFHTAQTETPAEWEDALREKAEHQIPLREAESRTQAWWKAYWQRSYVCIDPERKSEDIDWQTGRNYQLFRYMQASNAYGEFPTKFNGGLFTVDQCAWHHPNPEWNPDHRDWGGIMFTAQNQRLVYWPMIKNGDFDMMKPAFEFYRRIVTPMKKRTEHFFGLPDCACYCEQIDANGLSSHYGFYGVDYPLQVRHHYVEALEFSYMIVRWHITCGGDITPYMDFIRSVLDFYDRKYASLDERGKRIIFPSTAMETYHGEELTQIYGEPGRYAANYNESETAVTNPADVIAALSTTITELLSLPVLCTEDRERYEKLLEELPPIPTEFKNGKTVIAPCEYPKDYKKGNCEIPQLNTVHPYHSYGLFSDDLTLAIDTYFHGWDDPDQLDHISWHPNGCYAARLGLTEEAHKYLRLKLGDSGRRFPAFWGPGHDYTPDHNWGGSGMMVAQEMLMQTYENRIYLLPAWPEGLDVSFRLWADHNTQITAEYRNGRLSYTVQPEDRQKDILLPEYIRKNQTGVMNGESKITNEGCFFAVLT